MPTPRSPRLRDAWPTAVLIAVIALLVTSGCSHKKPRTTELPPGADLVSAAATAMREVKTAHVVISAEGNVADLPLRRADGVLTRSGDAKGSIQIEQLGTLIEYQFVVLGDTIHLKGVTGGWQELPAFLASQIYDPSAILDPARGVVQVLTTATEAKTEAQETVNGRDAYRVGVKLDRTAVGALVPGVGEGVTGQFWIDAQTKQLVKAVLRIPGQGTAPGGTVTINVSDIDAPVTITAP
jgi:lipoprotein LprG